MEERDEVAAVVVEAAAIFCLSSESDQGQRLRLFSVNCTTYTMLVRVRGLNPVFRKKKKCSL